MTGGITWETAGTIAVVCAFAFTFVALAALRMASKDDDYWLDRHHHGDSIRNLENTTRKDHP